MGRFLIKNFDYLLITAMFLPYISVSEGIRIEQVVVYLLFLLIFFKGRLLHFKNKSFITILSLYLGIVLLVFIGSISYLNFSNEFFLANFENYSETFALLFIFNSMVNSKKNFTVKSMLRINTFFQILLALNTGIIFIEIFTPFADSILQYYVKYELGGYRVNINGMGRYMGVFNQPVESGFAYGLGLLTWFYNFTRKKKKVFLFEGILLLLILIGGFASVSKVFFMGSILLFILMFVTIGKVKDKIIFFTIVSFSLPLFIPLFISDWKGYEYLENQFLRNTTEFSMHQITAGRIGDESGIFSQVIDADLIFLIGRGFTQGDLPFFDSEYVQILYQGGGIAILFYLLMIFKNFKTCYTLNKLFYEEKILLFAILVLGVLTALGGPVLFMNRVRIFYFIQLAFLYKLSSINKTSLK